MKISAISQSFHTKNWKSPTFRSSKEEKEEEKENLKKFYEDMWNVGILSLPIVALPFAFAPSSCLGGLPRDAYQKTIQQQKITPSEADNVYKTDISDFDFNDILPENEKPEPVLTEDEIAEMDSIKQRKMLVERFNIIDDDDGLTISEAEFRKYLDKSPYKLDAEKFQKYAGKDRELNIDEFINMYKNLSSEEKN